MRVCACVTASRLCVRTVLCSSAFLLVPSPPSTNSAVDCSTLFAGFAGTIDESDFSSRSSSAMASGLPDAALGTVFPGRNEDLPVPAQEMCVHAQGLKTTQGGQGPRDDGPGPVAFCLPRRHRHPGLHCFRRSIPRLYAPLSTLRVLPHGSGPRMTRGQCGSLLLHCNGLSPSTSCRSSRRTVAQSHTPRNRCATLRVRRYRRLTQHSLPGGLPGPTWAGLPPAERASFAWRLPLIRSLRRPEAETTPGS